MVTPPQFRQAQNHILFPKEVVVLNGGGQVRLRRWTTLPCQGRQEENIVLEKTIYFYSLKKKIYAFILMDKNYIN